MKILGQYYKDKPYNRCYMISNLNCMSLITWKEINEDLFGKFINDMLALWHQAEYWRIPESWPTYTIKRWKDNMWDTFIVENVKILSSMFFWYIIKWYPMVISIRVWKQFILDREDWELSDIILDDESTEWHSTVLKWYRIYDSRWDQKTYSVTRKYLETIKWLFSRQNALVFKKI